MSSLPLIEMQGVKKFYPRVQQASDRLRALFSLLGGQAYRNGTTVLEGIDLRVMPGESLAVIGENGAGKSTLLKVLTGVLRPTEGTVTQRGSSAALLELGAGFQPEFSGMENIRMKAALLGLNRRQVEEKLDHILAFADIGEYIHEPVKHYSSGMVVRLGFAVVTAVNPDLLITDEVLAVGDESFQKKCIAWIEQYLEQGGTLMMVSHNLYQVQKLCSHALWLREGKMHRYGQVFEVCQDYLAFHERKTAREKEKAQASGGMYQVSELIVQCGENNHQLNPEDDIIIQATLSSPDDRAPVVLVGVVRVDGTPVYGVPSDMDNARPQQLENGHYRYRLKIHRPQLLPGSYTIRVHAMDPEGLRLCHTEEHDVVVAGDSRELGLVRLQHEWLDQDGTDS